MTGPDGVDRLLLDEAAAYPGRPTVVVDGGDGTEETEEITGAR